MWRRLRSLPRPSGSMCGGTAVSSRGERERERRGRGMAVVVDGAGGVALAEALAGRCLTLPFSIALKSWRSCCALAAKRAARPARTARRKSWLPAPRVCERGESRARGAFFFLYSGRPFALGSKTLLLKGSSPASSRSFFPRVVRQQRYQAGLGLYLCLAPPCRRHAHQRAG